MLAGLGSLCLGCSMPGGQGQGQGQGQGAPEVLPPEILHAW